MDPLTILSTLSLFGLMILIIIGMYKMVKLIGDKSTKDVRFDTSYDNILFTIWVQKMLQVTVIETKVLLTIAAICTTLATGLVYFIT